jgi:hypothetical protein
MHSTLSIARSSSFSLPVYVSMWCLLFLFLRQCRFCFRLNGGFVAGFLDSFQCSLSLSSCLCLSVVLALSLPGAASVSLPTEWRLRSRLSTTECTRLYSLLALSFSLPVDVSLWCLLFLFLRQRRFRFGLNDCLLFLFLR